jgi:hypothetical protein
VTAAQGQPARAAILLGIGEAFRSNTHRPLLPLIQNIVDEFTAAAQAALGKAAYMTAWEHGRRMAPDDALKYVLTG